MTRLGCVADDYTGGTDVAAGLRRAGLSVRLLFGPPTPQDAAPEVDALVVALKSRTIPAAEAVATTVTAAGWMLDQGVDRLYFKYCSTFDSTDAGNIGPVTDALADLVDAAQTLVCPASPEHGRTTYQGHHFVGDRLLSESSMGHHPLTPMTDPDLVRVLGRQTPHSVGLLPLGTILAGAGAVTAALVDLHEQGTRYVVTDAATDADLTTLAQATLDWPLLTGGAGLAGAIGAVTAEGRDPQAAVALPNGPAIVLAGSCSATTLAQVEAATHAMPTFRLDPAATPDPHDLEDQALAWLREHWSDAPLLVYSSADAEQRKVGLAAMGPKTPDLLEQVLAAVAREAVVLGARRVVVAGGETSGAVVSGLGVRSVEVTGEADRGVPWCLTTDATPVALLLKSGNFGQRDLLVRATRATP